MKIYLVGGAVRDELLGKPTVDRDWVVVGASPQDMLDLGYLQVGKDFPVFLHPQTREEYALARRERKTAPGHTGFDIEATPTVTLEEDLLRRDLTINAIAKDNGGNLVDPYGGCRDIQQGILRHVSEAFAEDPLRVLRVARFAARFADRGFSIAPETRKLMTQMSHSGELEHLPAERIWRELETALRETAPAVFVRVLRDCGALHFLLPELDMLFDIPEPAGQHPDMDTGRQTLLALEQACRLTPDPIVRYAVLLHDVGKAVIAEEGQSRHDGDGAMGATLVEQVGARLRIPREFNAAAKLLASHYLRCHQLLRANASTILQLLESLDSFRRPQQLEQFIHGCKADAFSRAGTVDEGDSNYPQAERLRMSFEAACGVNISALLESEGLLPQQQDDAPPDSKQQRALHIQAVIREARIEAISRALLPVSGAGP